MHRYTATIFFLLLLATSSYGQNSKPSKLQELKVDDKQLYELLLKVKTDKNANEIEAIAAYFMQKLRTSVVQTFLSKTDSGIFKKIPAESLADDSVTRYKLYILRSCDSLFMLCESKNYADIIRNIEQINVLTKRINEGNGLTVMKKLTEKQKIYIGITVANAIDYYNDYYKVASAYNPTLPTEVKKVRLAELSKKYNKPIQQAFINQELGRLGR